MTAWHEGIPLVETEDHGNARPPSICQGLRAVIDLTGLGRTPAVQTADRVLRLPVHQLCMSSSEESEWLALRQERFTAAVKACGPGCCTASPVSDLLLPLRARARHRAGAGVPATSTTRPSRPTRTRSSASWRSGWSAPSSSTRSTACASSSSTSGRRARATSGRCSGRRRALGRAHRARLLHAAHLIDTSSEA